jgi:ergothioneine biosynthesis protein EgtB
MPDSYPPSPADLQGDALRQSLATRFQRARSRTTGLAAPLSPEDLMVQSHAGGAPAKWHLAHTTWLFESRVLIQAEPGYRPFDPAFALLFAPRDERSGRHLQAPSLRLLSRPTAEEVMRYRDYVNAAILHLLKRVPDEGLDAIAEAIELGIVHERRHQERLLCDIKHAFWCNPLRPRYEPVTPAAPPAAQPPPDWVEHGGGMVEIGRARPAPGVDHECPRHARVLPPFRLSTRLATCGEYMSFVADGGYTKPSLWLADGWEALRTWDWQAPLYWEPCDGDWRVFTLYGLRPLDPAEPVCHVSYYEADAFARWAGARLPDEAEWEVVAATCLSCANVLGNGERHPSPLRGPDGGMRQMFGEVWEWTRSPFAPYPGTPQPTGFDSTANGRFMTNRMVLRGGSCATAFDMATPTARHYLRPAARTSFSGIRLAMDI